MYSSATIFKKANQFLQQIKDESDKPTPNFNLMEDWLSEMGYEVNLKDQKNRIRNPNLPH